MYTWVYLSLSDDLEVRRAQISPVYLSIDPKYAVDDVDFNLQEAYDNSTGKAFQQCSWSHIFAWQIKQDC